MRYRDASDPGGVRSPFRHEYPPPPTSRCDDRAPQGEAGDVSRRLGPDALARGLLLFWTLYFSIVALSNLADVLRVLGALPPGWGWASGNLAFIATSVWKVGAPAGVAPWLLAGVVAWQALAAGLFGRAVGHWPRIARTGDWFGLTPPFVVSVGLWAVFVLLDEALLIFETGAEAAHLRLLSAGLLTLLVLRGLAGWAAEGEPPRAGAVVFADETWLPSRTLRRGATRLWFLAWATFLAYGGLAATAHQAGFGRLATLLGRWYPLVLLLTAGAGMAFALLVVFGAVVDAVRGRTGPLAAVRVAVATLVATALLVYAMVRWFTPSFPMGYPG